MKPFGNTVSLAAMVAGMGQMLTRPHPFHPVVRPTYSRAPAKRSAGRMLPVQVHQLSRRSFAATCHGHRAKGTTYGQARVRAWVAAGRP